VKHSFEISRFCLIPAFLGTGINKGKASSEIHEIAEPAEMKKPGL
jgi:ribosomal protein S5